MKLYCVFGTALATLISIIVPTQTNATTYFYQGNPLLFTYTCGMGCPPTVPAGLSVVGEIVFNFDTSNTSGMFDMSSSAITFKSLSYTNSGALPPTAFGSVTISLGAITAWSLSNSIPGPNGTFVSSATNGDSVSFLFAGEGRAVGTAGPGLWSPTISAVPLPAALPLFATGLGALGLLGWRRKRKLAA
jgi:hypothetical protein